MPELQFSNSFTKDELKLLSHSLHFLEVCLDRDSVILFKDVDRLSNKVDRMVKERKEVTA